MSQELDSVTVGDSLPVRRIGPLTRMDFARFSIAADDPNRVHIEEGVAREAGLPDVIGSGGIVVGLLTDLVTSWGGPEILQSASFRIMAPLFPGTVLLAGGRVMRWDSGDNGSAEIVAYADDESGQRLGEGTFCLRVPAPVTT